MFFTIVVHIIIYIVPLHVEFLYLLHKSTINIDIENNLLYLSMNLWTTRIWSSAAFDYFHVFITESAICFTTHARRLCTVVIIACAHSLFFIFINKIKRVNFSNWKYSILSRISIFSSLEIIMGVVLTADFSVRCSLLTTTEAIILYFTYLLREAVHQRHQRMG